MSRATAQEKIDRMVRYFQQVPCGASIQSEHTLSMVLPRKGADDRSTLPERVKEFAKENGLTAKASGTEWRFTKP